MVKLLILCRKSWSTSLPMLLPDLDIKYKKFKKLQMQYLAYYAVLRIQSA